MIIIQVSKEIKANVNSCTNHDKSSEQLLNTPVIAPSTCENADYPETNDVRIRNIDRIRNIVEWLTELNHAKEG